MDNTTIIITVALAATPPTVAAGVAFWLARAWRKRLVDLFGHIQPMIRDSMHLQMHYEQLRGEHEKVTQRLRVLEMQPQTTSAPMQHMEATTRPDGSPWAQAMAEELEQSNANKAGSHA